MRSADRTRVGITGQFNFSYSVPILAPPFKGLGGRLQIARAVVNNGNTHGLEIFPGEQPNGPANWLLADKRFNRGICRYRFYRFLLLQIYLKKIAFDRHDGIPGIHHPQGLIASSPQVRYDATDDPRETNMGPIDCQAAGQ